MRAGTSVARLTAKTAGSLLLVGLGIVSTFFVAAQAAPAATSERLAVVFPPWWSRAHIAAAAASAGDIVGAGSVPFILILRGESADLGARSRQAGALLLLDPEAAGLCAPPVQEPRP
jgi:microcompartment protein CcmK/EutM